MIEYVRDEALPDRDEILVRLASHDRDLLLRILTLLCPCRNQCYDVEVWSKLPAIRDSQWDFEVREAASHAIGTLQERARVDHRSRRLLDALAAAGLGIRAYAPWMQRQLRSGARVRYPKLAKRDVSTLIEALASDDGDTVADAFEGLCPSDGRHVPHRVWRAIEVARRDARADVRAKAERAARRLAEHARSCGRHRT